MIVYLGCIGFAFVMILSTRKLMSVIEMRALVMLIGVLTTSSKAVFITLADLVDIIIGKE